MDKKELITKQQLQIEELKNIIKSTKEDFKNIHGILYSCGAPLNDNVLNFSKKQMMPLFKIGRIVNDWLKSSKSD